MAVPLYDTETECHGPVHVHTTKFLSPPKQDRCIKIAC